MWNEEDDIIWSLGLNDGESIKENEEEIEKGVEDWRVKKNEKKKEIEKEWEIKDRWGIIGKERIDLGIEDNGKKEKERLRRGRKRECKGNGDG